MKIKGWQWPQERFWGGTAGGELQGKDGNRQMLWVVPETHRESSTESHQASRATQNEQNSMAEVWELWAGQR